MNYLFDTSALAVHALNLPGAADVQLLMDDESNGLFLSALSLFELAAVLKRQGSEKRILELWHIYREGLELVPVDAALAQGAWELRESLAQRIPMADAMIAAAARSHGATLVHRDQHLATIPEPILPQIRLPAV